KPLRLRLSPGDARLGVEFRGRGQCAADRPAQGTADRRQPAEKMDAATGAGRTGGGSARIVESRRTLGLGATAGLPSSARPGLNSTPLDKSAVARTRSIETQPGRARPAWPRRMTA